MTYAATLPAPPPVDGYIMQAPTSDRETASLLMSADFLRTSLQHAEELIADGKEMQVMPADLIPPIFSSPITAYRWHSLASVGGDDDFFSSDLPASTLQSTFGKLDKPTLIAVSEKDEMVPSTVDKEALFKRWADAMPEGLLSEESGVLPHADHELTTDIGNRRFTYKVWKFLKDLEQAK
jgi:pimeloyl-ACP methyl ester carboxylesterase